MVATDGHRLAHIETTASKVDVKEEIRVLVPRKALAEINALLNSSGVEGHRVRQGQLHALLYHWHTLAHLAAAQRDISKL